MYGVLAPRAVRVARVMARDGLTEERACARIDAQPDDAFYRVRCRWIIENGGTREETERQCAQLLDFLSG